MTQTQDDQNLQAQSGATQDVQGTQPGTSTPVSDQSTTNTTIDSTITNQPTEDSPSEAKPVEGSTEQSTSDQTEKDESIIQQWTNVVKDTIHTWVEKVQEIWQTWIEQIKDAWTQTVNTGKEAVQWAVSTGIEAWQSAVQWIVWAAKDLTQGVSDTFHNATSWEWIIDSWKAVVKWTIWTTAQVVHNAASTTVNAAESAIHSGADIATNVAKTAGWVVQNSINGIAWTVLPEKWAQIVQDIQNKVSQWAETLGNQAKETLEEWWKKAKGFFAGLWDSFKSGFSTKNAKEIMQEASTPVEPVVQNPASATPVIEQPTAPVVEQPSSPIVEQPASNVQQWDIQQPTPTN